MISILHFIPQPVSSTPLIDLGISLETLHDAAIEIQGQPNTSNFLKKKFPLVLPSQLGYYLGSICLYPEAPTGLNLEILAEIRKESLEQLLGPKYKTNLPIPKKTWKNYSLAQLRSAIEYHGNNVSAGLSSLGLLYTGKSFERSIKPRYKLKTKGFLNLSEERVRELDKMYPPENEEGIYLFNNKKEWKASLQSREEKIATRKMYTLNCTFRALHEAFSKEDKPSTGGHTFMHICIYLGSLGLTPADLQYYSSDILKDQLKDQYETSISAPRMTLDDYTLEEVIKALNEFPENYKRALSTLGLSSNILPKLEKKYSTKIKQFTAMSEEYRSQFTMESATGFRYCLLDRSKLPLPPSIIKDPNADHYHLGYKFSELHQAFLTNTDNKLRSISRQLNKDFPDLDNITSNKLMLYLGRIGRKYQTLFHLITLKKSSEEELRAILKEEYDQQILVPQKNILPAQDLIIYKELKLILPKKIKQVYWALGINEQTAKNLIINLRRQVTKATIEEKKRALEAENPPPKRIKPNASISAAPKDSFFVQAPAIKGSFDENIEEFINSLNSPN